MEKDIHQENVPRSANSTSFFLLLGIVFFLPLFILPWLEISIETTKNFFFVFFVTLLVLVWLFLSFRNKKITLIPGGVFLMAWFLSIGTLVVSTFLSSIPLVSITGLGYEVGTAVSLFLFFVLLLISSILLQKKGRILLFYTTIALSSFIVFLFELVNILGGNFLGGEGITIIGGWFNLAIFAGFNVVLTLTILINPVFSRIYRMFALLVLVAALMVLVLLSFKPAWIMVVIFSLLLLFIQVLVIPRGTNQNSLGGSFKIVLTVLVLSVFFVSFGGTVGNVISRTFAVSPITEVRPSWDATHTVLSSTLTKNISYALFGSGPNTFSYQWNIYKPASVNTSLLWDVTPEMGRGFLPTLVVTTGMLGVFTLVVFLSLLFYHAFRIFFKQIRNNQDSYFIMSTVLLTLYGWLWALLYPINIVMLTLVATVTGGLLALLIQKRAISSISLEKILQYRKLSILLIIVILIFGTWGLYTTGKRFISIMYYEEGLTFASQDNSISAAEYILKALKFSDQAPFYRSLSEVQQAQMKTVLAQEGKIPTEELQKRFEGLEFQSRENARKATQIDKENYLNWIVFGNHYFTLTRFSIPDVYTDGSQHYEKAASLNPKSPAILFLQARLALSQRDIQGATVFLEEAVVLKPDYGEANTLLSELRGLE